MRKTERVGLLEYPDDIRVGHKEREWEVVKWIHLAQDTDQRRALVQTVKNFKVSITCKELHK